MTTVPLAWNVNQQIKSLQSSTSELLSVYFKQNTPERWRLLESRSVCLWQEINQHWGRAPVLQRQGNQNSIRCECFLKGTQYYVNIYIYIIPRAGFPAESWVWMTSHRSQGSELNTPVLVPFDPRASVASRSSTVPSLTISDETETHSTKKNGEESEKTRIVALNKNCTFIIPESILHHQLYTTARNHIMKLIQ